MLSCYVQNCLLIILLLFEYFLVITRDIPMQYRKSSMKLSQCVRLINEIWSLHNYLSGRYLSLLWITVYLPCHGPLARYVKFRAARAPGIKGTFFPPPRVSDPDMYHGTCVMLTRGYLSSRWRGNRSRHIRRMCNLQFYVSGRRPITQWKSLEIVLSCNKLHYLLSDIQQTCRWNPKLCQCSFPQWTVL